MFQKRDSKILRHDDFVEEGALSDFIHKEIDDLVKALPVASKEIQKWAKEVTGYFKSIKIGDLEKFDLTGFKALNEQIRKTNQLSALHQKITVAEAKASDLLNKKQQSEAKTGAAIQKQKQEEAKTGVTIQKQKQEAIKSSTALQKQKQAEIQADIALSKLNQEKFREEKAKIDLDAKKQKQQEKNIQLTDKEIAQRQLDKEAARDKILLLKAEVVEMSKTAGTLERVMAANTRLRIERKGLNTDTAEGKKRLQEINLELDRNNKYIIENSDKLKQQRMNVGNYTQSIREAFDGTGMLGDAINKYLGIIENLSEKIEGVVGWIVKEKVAKEADTIATKANTVAEEKNAAATAVSTATHKANTAGLKAETAATETATVATNTLSNSIKKLSKNPYVLAAIALAALTKVVFDNVTATQEQKDAWEASEEGLKAWSKAILVAGVDANKLRKAVRDLTLDRFKLEDKEIASIVNQQRLRTEAAKAREEAQEENKTVRERILLLTEYIDKIRSAYADELEEARINSDLKQKEVVKFGKLATREQRKAAEEAKAKVLEIEESLSNEIRKTLKQRAGLIEQYNEDVLKMAQEAQRLQIESIDTAAAFRAQQLKKELNKNLKLLKLDTDQAVENRRREQEKLGAVDANGIDHTKEFESELTAIRNAGAAKRRDLVRNFNQEIIDLNEEFFQKTVETEEKFRAEIKKLDDAFNNLRHGNKQKEEDNIRQANEFAIEQGQEKIDELRKQRDQDIADGKQKYKLTLDDLQQYFDEVDKLQTQHYADQKKRLEDNAQFERDRVKQEQADALADLDKKYQKLKEEEDKAILDKNEDSDKAKDEIAAHDKDREQNKAAEAERINRNSAEELNAIDLELKGDLDKNDQEDLKRRKQAEKDKTDVARDGLENRKILAEEERRLFNQVTDGIQKGLQKRSEIQQQADQRDIDFHQRMVEVQAKLAAEGKDNVLAEELAAAARAEEKKLQDAKDAQRTQENIALAKVFNEVLTSELEKDQNFGKAFLKALAAMGATDAVFDKLFSGGFYEGAESLGNEPGKAIPFKKAGSKDDILVHAKEGERMIGYEDSQKLAKTGITNKELVEAGLNYMKDDFHRIYVPQFETANVSSTRQKSDTQIPVMTMAISDKLDTLIDVVESKPVGNTSLDGLGEWTETIERNGIAAIIHHKRQSRRPSMRVHGG